MRLIDADWAERKAKEIIDGYAWAIRMAVGNAPTVDAVPVVHGRWAENKYGYITCSICDSFPLESMTGSLITMHYEPYESEYCPYCGAKMDGEANDHG